jgi:pantetheine-phosphate adenylyltransferase
MLAVYPGTFDPFTIGHLDILERSSKIFEKVIIAISNSPNKNTVFNLDERVAMTKECVSKYQNVEVIGFKGMLIDFLKEQNADILVRGIRNMIDSEYELSLQGMYKMLMPELEVILLQSSPKIAFISSTLVREVILHKGDISPFVPNEIFEYIKNRKKN